MEPLTTDEKKVLRAVLRKVRTTHWVRRTYATVIRRKQYGCLVGLVNMACGIGAHTSSSAFGYSWSNSRRGLRDSLMMKILIAIVERQTRYRGKKPGTIEAWNDNARRTREHVEDLLEGMLA